MPTEQEILAAGPLSPDDPHVQAALRKLSRAMARGEMELMELEERARRAAAAGSGSAAPAKGQQPPEDPPPEYEKGAAPRPEGAAPTCSSITTTDGSHSEGRRRCYV